MLLYLVKYTLKGNDKGAHLKPIHIDYLKKHYDEGTLLTAGLFIGKVGGYLLFRTESYGMSRRFLLKLLSNHIFGACGYNDSVTVPTTIKWLGI
jgi:uncharacterized protein